MVVFKVIPSPTDSISIGLVHMPFDCIPRPTALSTVASFPSVPGPEWVCVRTSLVSVPVAFAYKPSWDADEDVGKVEGAV